MLLIDGVKYEEWTDLKETEDLEPMIEEHAKDIFGKNTEYFNIKKRLEAYFGKSRIPDGYLIEFTNPPQWHVVEIELSNHPIDSHIREQVSDFITATQKSILENRQKIADEIFHAINNNNYLRKQIEDSYEIKEIYWFLRNLILDNAPSLTVIIERKINNVEEQLNAALRYTPLNILEFRTFIKEGVDKKHTHLFETLYEKNKKDNSNEAKEKEYVKKTSTQREYRVGIKASKVTFMELINTGLLNDDQVLYFYNTRVFEDERVRVIMESDRLKYEKDGKTYSKSELAGILLEKHGFKRGDYPVQGPKFWKTKDGKLLDDLNEQVRKARGDRG